MDEHHALTWALYLLGSDALQVSFRHMVQIRKPTQDAAMLVREQRGRLQRLQRRTEPVVRVAVVGYIGAYY